MERLVQSKGNVSEMHSISHSDGSVFHSQLVFAVHKAKTSYINVLSAVIEFKRDHHEQEWGKESHDFLCNSVRNGANDSQFTVACMDQLGQLEIVKKSKKIFIFSDNSGKHFKNRFVIAKVMNFANLTKTDILWCFYAPDHGNSLCDGHFGRLSQKRRAAPGGTNDYATPDKLAALINTMETTSAHIILIDRSQKLTGKNIVGIKQFYSFSFDIVTNSVQCFDFYGGVQQKVVKYTESSQN